MLVVAELAKEKLARELERFIDSDSSFLTKRYFEKAIKLIRNTDLTDCQQTEEKAKSDE